MAADGIIPDRLLVSALEFAMGQALLGARQAPPQPYPTGLRKYLKDARLKPKAWPAVRAAIEADPAFRERVGARAHRDLVDEAGRLWLQRPKGWEQRLVALADGDAGGGAGAGGAGAGGGGAGGGGAGGAGSGGVAPSLTADLRAAERRRLAAEETAERLRAELQGVRDELRKATERTADLVASAEKSKATRVAAVDEAKQARVESRQATDRAIAATDRLAGVQRQLDAALARAAEAEFVRDGVLEARQAELLAGEEPDWVQHITAPPPRPPAQRGGKPKGRQPVGVPGGVYGSSRDAADFLVRRPGALVLVDGYNVAKLGWPRLSLEQQRSSCIAAAEDIVRRAGARVSIVFDGDGSPDMGVVQSRIVTVRFSPPGVKADAVLCAEVARQPDRVPVVVVTNDNEIIADVRARGANVISSEQFLVVTGRRS